MQAPPFLFLDLRKVAQIQSCILSFIQERPSQLTKAIQQSVTEQLFQEKDLHFALNHLKDQLERGELVSWANQLCTSVEGDNNRLEANNPKRVLALLAGNLPLVGFQDVLALILFGATAAVKLSKKDPYLTDALLKQLAMYDLIPHLRWSTDLTDLDDYNATHWLFTGDEKNFLSVKSLLEKKQAIQQSAKQLVRKAGVSVCFVHDTAEIHSTENVNSLLQAIYQYEGKGCRSVGIIVLNDAISFEDFEHSFKKHEIATQKQTISDLAFYEMAFLTACGFSRFFVDGMIFTTDPTAWSEAGKVTVLSNKTWEKGVIPAEKIQSFYVFKESKILGLSNYELLNTAQRPPLFWKADGIDTVEWLITAK